MHLPRVLCLISCAFVLGNLPGVARPVSAVSISAPAFAEGKPIPAKYSYKGKNISPEVRITNIPANAKSLVLIVDDPDAPAGVWTHWLLWNLPPTTTVIAEGKVPSGAVQGKNSFGNDHYDGPVPPNGTHRYYFRIYALDITLSLPPGSDHNTLVNAFMDTHVVGLGETYGVYSTSP